MQTADITEQTTNKRNFTDPSNKVKIKRVPKQIKDLNGKIKILLELHRNICNEEEKKNLVYGLKPSPRSCYTQMKAYCELSGKTQSWKTTVFLGKG